MTFKELLNQVSKFAKEMIDVRNGAKLYGFTLKNTDQKEQVLCRDTYTHVLSILASRGELLDVVYEDLRKDHVTKARLHVHGLIDFTTIPKLITLCPKGFSSKFERIYNVEGWMRYCHKN